MCPKVESTYSRLSMGIKRFRGGSDLSADAGSMVGISRTKNIQTIQTEEEKMELGHDRNEKKLVCTGCVV